MEKSGAVIILNVNLLPSIPDVVKGDTPNPMTRIIRKNWKKLEKLVKMQERKESKLKKILRKNMILKKVLLNK